MKRYLRAYLREKPFFFSLLRPKEASLYQKFKPFTRPILDLGCGDGFFAHVAFGRVDVGLDVVKSEIKEAPRWRVYKNVVEYNGKEIPYKDRYFSTVLCNSTLEHIPNVSEVLREVSRVTKKGGMFYFTVPTNLWAEYLFLNKIFGSLYTTFFTKQSKHYNLYSFSQWEKKLSSLGFTVVYETHYLDNKRIMWLFDVAHYISIPSLLFKKVFHRWVLFTQKTKYFQCFEERIVKGVERNTERGPYLFIAAKKL